MFATITMLAAAAAEAAQEASKSGLPQLDANYYTPQLFWLAVSFATLWFLMAKVALPGIGEVINERRDRVKRDIEAAGRLKAETDRALSDYEKALADARSNASGIAKQTRESMSAETDAEKARVEAQIAAKLHAADARIAATKTKSLSAVNDIAAETASAVVSRLIGQDVSLADVKHVLRPVAGE